MRAREGATAWQALLPVPPTGIARNRGAQCPAPECTGDPAAVGRPLRCRHSAAWARSVNSPRPEPTSARVEKRSCCPFLLDAEAHQDGDPIASDWPDSALIRPDCAQETWQARRTTQPLQAHRSPRPVESLISTEIWVAGRRAERLSGWEVHLYRSSCILITAVARARKMSPEWP